MSDPISTARVLKQQRDKLQDQLDRAEIAMRALNERLTELEAQDDAELWEWFDKSECDLICTPDGYELTEAPDANGLAKVLACDPHPREAVRKAMDAK